DAADAEPGDGNADHREAQAKPRVQVGRDVGEGAEEDRALAEYRDDDEAAPGVGQQAAVVADETGLALGGAAHRLGPGIAAKLAREREARDREHHREYQEHRAPAEMIADDAAGDLAGDHAGHLSREEPRQHR